LLVLLPLSFEEEVLSTTDEEALFEEEELPVVDEELLFVEDELSVVVEELLFVEEELPVVDEELLFVEEELSVVDEELLLIEELSGTVAGELSGTAIGTNPEGITNVGVSVTVRFIFPFVAFIFRTDILSLPIAGVYIKAESACSKSRL
jgi:hypothetical protein